MLKCIFNNEKTLKNIDSTIYIALDVNVCTKSTKDVKILFWGVFSKCIMNCFIIFKLVAFFSQKHNIIFQQH